MSAASSRIRPEVITLNGRPVGLLRYGAVDGPPLVLVHGFAGDKLAWQYNIAALGRVYRVHVIDLPGHGASAALPEAVAWRGMADWLGTALGTLALDRPHLVGHSLGARLCLDLAGRASIGARSLTLIAGAGLAPRWDHEFLGRLSRVADEAEALACARILFGGAQLALAPFARHMLHRLDRAAMAAILERNRQDPELQAVSAYDWASVPCPVQIIWGADDPVVPPPPPAWLAGAETHLIDAVGHLPHVAAADRVNRLILDFAARAEAQPQRNTVPAQE